MRASLVADWHAFAAAGVKEFRILRRYPTLFLGFLFWPIVLPFSYVLQARGFAGNSAAAEAAFASRAGTGDVVGFLFLGFTAYMWISMILWGPGTALRTEQVRGSLEALFLTPASRLVILFGPAFSQIVWALYMFGLVGRPISLRSITRSRPKPKAIMVPMPSPTASQSGAPQTPSAAATRMPAIITNSPWAKFTASVAL